MTGKKESGATWHHTTVVLRSDIYRQAVVQGIDISDACNRALAGLTGTEYHRQQLEEVPPPPPVIVARTGSLPLTPADTKKTASQKLHPVINADDPAAPATVVQAKAPVKKARAESPAPVPVPAPATPEEKPAGAPVTAPKKAPVQKGRAVPAKKRSRGDALKTFFTLKIVRTDETDARVNKDELYELFARYCREHRITPVPERKTITVSLKNQYALTEKSVNGTPCWTGIRLK